MECKNIVMAVIPQSEIDSIKAKLNEISSLIRNRNDDEDKVKWIEYSEEKKILGISQSTWQLMRDNRKMPFIQMGRRIYVKKSDLESYMEQHLIAAEYH